MRVATLNHSGFHLLNTVENVDLPNNNENEVALHTSTMSKNLLLISR